MQILKLNVSEHSGSWNTYDSLGEAYMDAGDSVQAVTNYRRSVELNPKSEGGKKMLEKLRGGASTTLHEQEYPRNSRRATASYGHG